MLCLVSILGQQEIAKTTHSEPFSMLHISRFRKPTVTIIFTLCLKMGMTPSGRVMPHADTINDDLTVRGDNSYSIQLGRGLTSCHYSLEIKRIRSA